MYYLAVFIIILSVIFLSYRKRDPRLPPGPSWRIPLLGHLPFLAPHLGKSLLSLKKKYGPIFCVQLGSYDTVALVDAKLIKEAFSNPALSGRPRMHFYHAGTQNKGLMFADGPELFEQRHFILTTLKDHGFRSKAMEERIQEEISKLLHDIELEDGKTLTVPHAFGLSIVNAFWSSLTGKRFAYGDNTLIYLSSLISKITALPNMIEGLAPFVPILSKLMPNLSGFNAGLKSFQNIHKFMAEEIQEVVKTRVSGQPANFTEAYLDKVEQTADEKSSFHPDKNYQPITFGDLFIGAVDSSSTVLAWTLAYLSRNLDKQQKLQSEISSVTGDSRTPCLSDRPSMPYTEAIMNEVLRISSLAPIGIMHRAMEDTTLRNYFIPKDTLITQNLYGVFHDPEVWGDPEVFRPERFIDDNGKFKKCEDLIAFGTGKRVCVGENLARDQLFLYISSIYQKFDVHYVGSPPNLEGKFGFLIKPDPFQIVFKKRI